MTTSDPDSIPTSLFTDYSKPLIDPRRTTKGNYQYPLEEILFLTISAIVCGWDDWEDIIYFGEVKN